MRLLRPALVACLAALPACRHDVTPPADGRLDKGTWGADGAGMIVSDSVAHVHIGCTLGNFAPPDSLPRGRFTVDGSYVLRAYPIMLGPELPARFEGTLVGARLSLSVIVNDTVEKKIVTLGPVTLTRGEEPRISPCPICRSID